MKKYIVRDFMVPISEYATVAENATLYEAVLALEKAQEDYAKNRYSHRAVLVMNADKRVIGKLSQLDFLCALEEKDNNYDRAFNLSHLGFSSKAIANHKEQHRKKTPPINEIYEKATMSNITKFMQPHSHEEYIEDTTSLDIAVHQLNAGPYLSLLVTKGTDTENIVGVLRLADVFSVVFNAMKKYESTITDRTDTG